MTFTEYRAKARRTQNKELTVLKKQKHALHGMVGELGEVLVALDFTLATNDFVDEAGDLCWFLAEYADVSLLHPETIPVENFTGYGGGSCTVDVHGNSKRVLLKTALAYYVAAIHSDYQKIYQGHSIDVSEHGAYVGKILGILDKLYSLRESGKGLDDILQFNVDKLLKRYPYGFDADRSVNREQYQ